MKSKPWVIAALAAFGWWTMPARAEEMPTPDYAQRIIEGKAPVAESTVTQTGCCDGGGGAPMITNPIGDSGCSTCGGGSGSQECGNGCPTGKCKPGRRCGTCYGDFERPDECSGKCARLFGSMFDCLCCPDPCYDPCWMPVANAAFFQDSARPRSHMRIRWDAGYGLTMPDRNEYFWARTGVKGPPNTENSLDYHELSLYNETAAGAFSFFVEVPYRQVSPDVNDFQSGFGDMNIGTKSMFVDCELMQVAFQFKTYIPIGNFTQGLGNGHVSLEPALLGTLKLAPKTYVQASWYEWIPIGGDQDWAGCLMHYHTSINHLLCCKGAFQFIPNFEFSGYTFQDGRVTNPPGWVPADTKSSGESYFYVGPGFRLVYCDRFDVGTGIAFAVSDDHFADQLYRTEFRVRW